MNNIWTWIACLLTLCIFGSCTKPGEGVSQQLCTTRKPLSFCPQPEHPDQLCSFIPHDVDFVQLVQGYAMLTAECQRTFDYFSWQSFVALNWPAHPDGTPMDSLNASSTAPRVWELYTDPKDVFNPTYTKKLHARANAKGSEVLTMMFKSDLRADTLHSYLEATTNRPLIDRNLNFVMYEIKVNDVWGEYIKKNGLTTLEGQQLFAQQGNQVVFTEGYYADTSSNSGGSVGAIEIKASWKIIDSTKGDDPRRFYTKQVIIYVDGTKSVTGKPLTIKALVGLVGFHINHYTTNRGGSGIWSTFEHIDNAPSLLQSSATDNVAYSFYNPDCKDCPVNTPPKLIGKQKNFLWSPRPPYASLYALQGKYGTQVVRTDSMFSGTEEVNSVWRTKLKGTVWENYKLIGTQWINGELSRPDSVIAIPALLTNTTLETYIQSQRPLGTCMFCHSGAVAAVPNLKSDFSFLLGYAKPESVF